MQQLHIKLITEVTWSQRDYPWRHGCWEFTLGNKSCDDNLIYKGYNSGLKYGIINTMETVHDSQLWSLSVYVLCYIFQ